MYPLNYKLSNDIMIHKRLTSQVSELFSFERQNLSANKAPSTFTVANTTSSHSLQQGIGVPLEKKTLLLYVITRIQVQFGSNCTSSGQNRMRLS